MYGLSELIDLSSQDILYKARIPEGSTLTERFLECQIKNVPDRVSICRAGRPHCKNRAALCSLKYIKYSLINWVQSAKTPISSFSSANPHFKQNESKEMLVIMEWVYNNVAEM